MQTRAGRRPQSGDRPGCATCSSRRAALIKRRSHRVRGVRFHQRARLGASRWRCWRSATRWWRCACSIRSSWSCPTSAWSRCTTPRPASSCASTPTTAAFASASRASPRSARPSCARRFARAGVDALELSTDDDLVDAIVRFADMRKRAQRAWRPAAACRRTCSAPRDVTESRHELPLAPIPLAAAGAAAAGAAVHAGCCGARRRWRCATPACRSCKEAMGAGQTLAPPRPAAAVPAGAGAPCCWPRRGRWRWSRCRPTSRPSSWRWTCRAACARPTSQPNRLVAAQDAAKAFIKELPRTREGRHRRLRRHGAGGAAADRNREDLVAAIDRFQLQRAHRHRQRHRGLAGHAVPRRGHRPAVDADRPRAPARRRRSTGRARRTRRSSRRWRRARTPRRRSSC